MKSLKDLKKIYRTESENSRFGGGNCSSREKDKKSKYKMWRQWAIQ